MEAQETELSSFFSGKLLRTGRLSSPSAQSSASADSAFARASLGRIAETGASVVLPGHGAPWTGGAADAVARACAVGAH